MKTIVLSKKGRNFEGRKLTENNINAGVTVFWDGSFFETGNRMYDLIELYKDGEFIITINIRHVRLVKAPKNFLIP